MVNYPDELYFRVEKKKNDFSPLPLLEFIFSNGTLFLLPQRVTSEWPPRCLVSIDPDCESTEISDIGRTNLLTRILNGYSRRKCTLGSTTPFPPFLSPIFSKKRNAYAHPGQRRPTFIRGFNFRNRDKIFETATLRGWNYLRLEIHRRIPESANPRQLEKNLTQFARKLLIFPNGITDNFMIFSISSPLYLPLFFENIMYGNWNGIGLKYLLFPFQWKRENVWEKEREEIINKKGND